MWITDRQVEGKVMQEIAPRSYPDGEFRRSRRHLIQLPSVNNDKNGENVTADNKDSGMEKKGETPCHGGRGQRDR